MVDPIKFEREALYEEIWTSPISTVSKRYDLSDNVLRKICKELGVPLPQFGHWARVRAGHDVKREPLHEHDGPTVVDAYPQTHRFRSAHSVGEADGKKRIEIEETEPENRIVPDLDENYRHPLVRAVAKRLIEIDRELEKENRPLKRGGVPHLLIASSRYIKGGGVIDPYEGFVPVLTTPAQRRRALAILDALLIGVELRGFKVAMEKNKAVVRQKDLVARIRLTELTRKVKEDYGSDSWAPLGRLRITLHSESYASSLAREVKISDDTGRPIEGQLNSLVAKLRCAVLGYEDRERERRLAAVKAENERIRRETIQWHERIAMEAATREKTQFDDLLSEADDWAALDRRRRYLEHLEEAALARGIGVDKDSDLGLWIARMRYVCNMLDPTESRLSLFRLTSGQSSSP